MKRLSRLTTLASTTSLLLIFCYLSSAVAETLTCLRQGAINLTVVVNPDDQKDFAGASFGYHSGILDSKFFASSVSLSAPRLLPEWENTEFGNRVRTFMVRQLNKDVHLVVQISDLRFSDSGTFVTRKSVSKFVVLANNDTELPCTVLGKPEVCGTLKISGSPDDAFFNVFLTLCAFPPPTSVSVTYGDQTILTRVSEVNNNGFNATYVFRLRNTHFGILSYEAKSIMGTLFGTKNLSYRGKTKKAFSVGVIVGVAVGASAVVLVLAVVAFVACKRLLWRALIEWILQAKSPSVNRNKDGASLSSLGEHNGLSRAPSYEPIRFGGKSNPEGDSPSESPMSPPPITSRLAISMDEGPAFGSTPSLKKLLKIDDVVPEDNEGYEIADHSYEHTERSEGLESSDPVL